MPDLNARVQPILDDLIGRDVECGLQVAAYIDGELVVDAWAGLADASTGRPVDGDTLFCLFSVTKGLTATAMHLLAERGQIDYDRPIAHYWPEFGRNGKQQMTVRHILSHTAGVPHMPDGIGLVDTYDWDRICQAITTLAPLWEPGTAAGYHTMTFGWILGEIARRVDGRSIATFVREELCQPLGITDLYFGIPDAVEPRVARLEGGELPPLPSDALLLRALPAWIFPMGETANQPGFRRAGLPWGGRHHECPLACALLCRPRRRASSWPATSLS